MSAVDVLEDQCEPRAVLDGCPQPRHRQPAGPDQRIKITEDPGFLPVQAWGIGIDLARGHLDEPAPPVAADNAGGQAWAEPAGCGRGLHDGGAAAHSTSARTCSGTSAQSTLDPSAGGPVTPLVWLSGR